MSSSDPDTNLIASWNYISDSLNKYVPIFIYIFGITGNLINIFVLGQRALRTNPSAAFFISTSIAGLIAIVSGLTSRMMAGFAVDLTNTVKWICIVRNYVLYTARTVTLWSIALATIDRWFSSNTNVHRRRISNLKNTLRAIVIVSVTSCLLNVPYSFCYEANLTGAVRGCYGSTYACRVITDVIYAFGTTLIPLMLMIIFGLLIVRNVSRTQCRVQNITMATVAQQSNTDNRKATNVNGRSQTRKRDRYLLKMLLVQVVLLCIFTCGHPIQKAYTSIAAITSSKTLQSAIENFILTVLTLLNFTASGMPFYIYTLSGGSTFRNAFRELIKGVGRKMVCR